MTMAREDECGCLEKTKLKKGVNVKRWEGGKADCIPEQLFKLVYPVVHTHFTDVLNVLREFYWVGAGKTNGAPKLSFGEYTYHVS